MTAGTLSCDIYVDWNLTTCFASTKNVWYTQLYSSLFASMKKIDHGKANSNKVLNIKKLHLNSQMVVNLPNCIVILINCVQCHSLITFDIFRYDAGGHDVQSPRYATHCEPHPHCSNPMYETFVNFEYFVFTYMIFDLYVLYYFTHILTSYTNLII